MTIILNSEIIDELKTNKIINLNKKYQKNSSDYNFFITPNIGFKLYNVKISDISINHIVFEYSKKDYLNLFVFLKKVNEHIIDLYKNSDSYESKTIYNLFVDKQDSFTIRCHLPHNKFKYFITNYENNIEKIFNLPKKYSTIDEVYIDIRNLWIKNEKVGFNLELKETRFI